MSAVDPIRVRREKAYRLSKLGKRIGYSLWGVAIVVYIIGMMDRFTSTMTSLIIGCLVAGSFVLIPSIIVAYGVRAASREDREVEAAKLKASAVKQSQSNSRPPAR
jgi:hypothetical protein